MSAFWGLPDAASDHRAVPAVMAIQTSTRSANIAQFRGIYNTFIVLFHAVYHALTPIWNLGYDNFDIGMAIMPAICLFFIFLGALMRRAKRNFFIGIRTPWTLSSDTVWEKTHALGSKLFIAAGILSLLTLPLGEYWFWAFMILVLIAAIIPIVYSYVLWKRETSPQA
jgi:uncharacterized membrane protein